MTVNALAETTNGLYKTECVYGPDAKDPGATLSTSNWPRSPTRMVQQPPVAQRARRRRTHRVRGRPLRSNPGPKQQSQHPRGPDANDRPVQIASTVEAIHTYTTDLTDPAHTLDRIVSPTR